MEYVREIEVRLKPNGPQAPSISGKIILRTERSIGDMEMTDVLSEVMERHTRHVGPDAVTFHGFAEELDGYVSPKTKTTWHVSVQQPRSAFDIVNTKLQKTISTTKCEKICGIPIKDEDYEKHVGRSRKWTIGGHDHD